MTNYAVDGTLIIARLRRKLPGGDSLFDEIIIQKPDGSASTMKSARVSGDVLRNMVPGIRGRFYLFDVAGSKGVAGFRGSDGTTAYRFPTFFEVVMGALVALNILVLGARFLIDRSIGFVPLTLAVLTLIMMLFFTQARIASRHRFDQDSARSA